MAGILATLTTAEVATGTSQKTIIQIVAAANHRVLVHEWGISFDGTSNTDAPIEVELLRQTTAGTMSALTAIAVYEGLDETIQTTGLHTASAEPTGTTLLRGMQIHPQGGVVWQAPFGQAIIIEGATRVGIAVTAAVGVNAIAYFNFEE